MENKIEKAKEEAPSHAGEVDSKSMMAELGFSGWQLSSWPTKETISYFVKNSKGPSGKLDIFFAADVKNKIFWPPSAQVAEEVAVCDSKPSSALEELSRDYLILQQKKKDASASLTGVQFFTSLSRTLLSQTVAGCSQMGGGRGVCTILIF